MRACWQLGGLLLLAGLAAGCAARQCQPEPFPLAAPVLLDCHETVRTALVPDVSLVAGRESLPTPEPPPRYCNLTERDAQCLAATNAPQARLLEQEAEAVAVQHGRHSTGSGQMTPDVLLLQATHERNRAASASLQDLLRLAEAEAGAANLRRRLDEVVQTLEDVRRLQSAGLQAPLSQAETLAQQLDLSHRLAEVELTIDHLNHQLVVLLGAEPPPGARLWPDVDLRVIPNVLNGDEAQDIALMQRADLAAMRLAAEPSGRESLSLARAVLSQAHAGLGLAASHGPLFSLLHFRARGDETAVRQDQLASAVADQERTVRREVAETVTTIEARLTEIGLTRRRIEILEQHQEALRQKEQLAAGAAFEVRKATLEVLAARQDLFHDVIEWKIALVKLHEAQGELAIECGFTAAISGCP